MKASKNVAANARRNSRVNDCVSQKGERTLPEFRKAACVSDREDQYGETARGDGKACGLPAVSVRERTRVTDQAAPGVLRAARRIASIERSTS